jgi:DNA-binding MarR family transcriptional regulator
MNKITVPVDLTNPVEAEIAERISKAWIAIRRGASSLVIRDIMLGTGEGALEAGQWDTLNLLTTRDEWRMGDLALALKVEPSTATRAIQRLINLGLAERVSRPGDGRVVHVAVTEEGRARAEILHGRSQFFLSYILSFFDDDERDLLAEFFERFTRAMDSAAEAATKHIKSQI